jgi:hypothetical protein
MLETSGDSNVIMEFEFEGVTYEALVEDFELCGICIKGEEEEVSYSYKLFLEAEELIMNDIVGMAEAASDQEQMR